MFLLNGKDIQKWIHHKVVLELGSLPRWASWDQPAA